MLQLVTILVGSNDLCNQMCHEETGAPSIWERHTVGLRDALDYLQHNLPRTLVNLVVTPGIIWYTDVCVHTYGN
jgi:hypothetical protein